MILVNSATDVSGAVPGGAPSWYASQNTCSPARSENGTVPAADDESSTFTTPDAALPGTDDDPATGYAARKSGGRVETLPSVFTRIAKYVAAPGEDVVAPGARTKDAERT
jgi:hypothetical protein